MSDKQNTIPEWEGGDRALTVYVSEMVITANMCGGASPHGGCARRSSKASSIERSRPFYERYLLTPPPPKSCRCVTCGPLCLATLLSSLALAGQPPWTPRPCAQSASTLRRSRPLRARPQRRAFHSALCVTLPRVWKSCDLRGSHPTMLSSPSCRPPSPQGAPPTLHQGAIHAADAWLATRTRLAVCRFELRT